MLIDWKHLATTKGYKSLKAAYIHDVQKAAKQKMPMRDKAEFLRQFEWVINRAKHYAHYTGESIETILNNWEEKRSYWWLNYYQDSRQPKFHSGTKKQMTINGIKKYYKKMPLYSSSDVKHRVNEFIQQEHKDNSLKKKKRWPMVRKKRGY